MEEYSADLKFEIEVCEAEGIDEEPDFSYLEGSDCEEPEEFDEVARLVRFPDPESHDTADLGNRSLIGLI